MWPSTVVTVCLLAADNGCSRQFSLRRVNAWAKYFGCDNVGHNDDTMIPRSYDPPRCLR